MSVSSSKHDAEAVSAQAATVRPSKRRKSTDGVTETAADASIRPSAGSGAHSKRAPSRAPAAPPTVAEADHDDESDAETEPELELDEDGAARADGASDEGDVDMDVADEGSDDEDEEEEEEDMGRASAARRAHAAPAPAPAPAVSSIPRRRVTIAASPAQAAAPAHVPAARRRSDGHAATLLPPASSAASSSMGAVETYDDGEVVFTPPPAAVMRQRKRGASLGGGAALPADDGSHSHGHATSYAPVDHAQFNAAQQAQQQAQQLRAQQSRAQSALYTPFSPGEALTPGTGLRHGRQRGRFTGPAEGDGDLTDSLRRPAHLSPYLHRGGLSAESSSSAGGSAARPLRVPRFPPVTVVAQAVGVALGAGGLLYLAYRSLTTTDEDRLLAAALGVLRRARGDAECAHEPARAVLDRSRIVQELGGGSGAPTVPGSIAERLTASLGAGKYADLLLKVLNSRLRMSDSEAGAVLDPALTGDNHFAASEAAASMSVACHAKLGASRAIAAGVRVAYAALVRTLALAATHPLYALAVCVLAAVAAKIYRNLSDSAAVNRMVDLASETLYLYQSAPLSEAHLREHVMGRMPPGGATEAQWRAAMAVLGRDARVSRFEGMVGGGQHTMMHWSSPLPPAKLAARMVPTPGAAAGEGSGNGGPASGNRRASTGSALPAPGSGVRHHAFSPARHSMDGSGAFDAMRSPAGAHWPATSGPATGVNAIPLGSFRDVRTGAPAEYHHS